MNAELRQIKTAAEQGLADAFARAVATLPGTAAVAELRAEAFRRFAAHGLPHRRVEEWKYTDLRALMRDVKPLAERAPVAHAERALAEGVAAMDVEARRLVFVNGALAPHLSDLAALEPGLTIVPLAIALAAGEDAVLDRMRGDLPADAMLALNGAFMSDGAVIRLAPGTALTRPLHLVCLSVGEPGAVYLRNLVDVGEGARLALIESHFGAEGRDDQVNVALDLVVRDRAHVDIVTIGAQSRRSLHIGSLIAEIGADARFNSFHFTTGGAVTRNQLFVRCAGRGSNLRLGGVNLLGGRQHADTTLVLDHAAVGCQSRETFKSVLDGESRGVFQGKIIVQPQAQKTDARMMTRALLLSESAEADNKPELEIFADDVQCGHGATAGALDEQLKFYLMARGLPERQAEALLIQAFIGEAVEGIEHAGLRDALMDAAVAWLGTRA